MRKPVKLTAFFLSLLLCLSAFAGCASTSTFAQDTLESAQQSSAEPGNESAAESGLKPYTIMVYMCGSDLESENGMASSDIEEMLGSGYDPETMNVVLYTGGTNQWQSYDIPNDENCIISLENGSIRMVREDPLASMGDPNTLLSFLNYAYSAYPAESYGLIMWDHGAGSVSGFGCDELFDYDSLTLDELSNALSQSPAGQMPFEFIGFDACLMANIETASTVSSYANYLVASEELEPGFGWDYSSLGTISQTPGLSGSDIGTILTDDFTNFYTTNYPEEQTTLSVIDLAQVDDALAKLEAFATVADNALQSGEYSTLAQSRSNTKSFGSMGQHGGDTDMADIVHLATQMQQTFPQESADLIDAIGNMVVYGKNSDNIDNANGLSVYFPFAEKDMISEWVPIYDQIGFSSAYTTFVDNFSSTLTGEDIYTQSDFAAVEPSANADGDYQITLSPDELNNIVEIYFTVWEKAEEGSDYYIQLGESSNVEIDENGMITTEFNGYWTTLNDYWVCMYELDYTDTETRYTIPAYLNGEDVDLVAVYSDEYPEGKIVGAMPIIDEQTGMPPKQMIPINQGDTITLLYYAEPFSDENGVFDETLDPYIWYEGEEFVVDGDLVLADYEVDAGDYLYGFYIVDTQQNGYYTDFVEVQYE